MRVLTRKLVRDLWRLRGQVVAVGLVIASGVAVMVMSLSTLDSLSETADAYYERYRFADVFTQMERAPLQLAERMAEIPGVQTVQTRIVKIATLDIDGFDEPVIGKFISVPERREPNLNRLAIRVGRSVSPGRSDEVVLSEPFAEAHGLMPGDRLHAVLNGKQRRLRVVGIALSPEFVYSISPGGLMPDAKRFGAIWMGEEALASAYDLDGAFNDASMTLLVNSAPEGVLQQLNKLTKPYGGIGAVARKDQISNWFLMNELAQLRSISAILPLIFLGVAAFLTQMVLSRLVTTERSEIGLLKAFGYTKGQIARHYAALVVAIAAVGIVIGWLAGAWLGRYSTEVYAELYRFPFLHYQPGLFTFALSAVISIGAALTGAMRAVYGAATLPPAAAMQPPAPPSYRAEKSVYQRLLQHLDQPTRIICRQIGRYPYRSLLTSIGIAFSVGVLIMALQWMDSINEIVDVYFSDAQRQDVTISLANPRGNEVVRAVKHLPGVLHVEPARIVPAEFRVRNLRHRGAINGLSPTAHLNPPYDIRRGDIAIPADGLVVESKLANKLGVAIGDPVQVEILEGRHAQITAPIVDIFESYIGMDAYMRIDGVNRIMKEGGRVEYLNLLIDPRDKTQLFKALKQIPGIAAVSTVDAAVDMFHETLAETLIVYVTFYVAFACTLAFGLAYNSTRIALSERGRELATLRVLGFNKSEISYILLGEVALLIVFSLPLGCGIGWGLAWIMASEFETELFRIPLIIHGSTYGFAMLITLFAAFSSALIVRRQADALDLIKVLKTRE
ncbi:MAG: ABC transporter permease [Gammaproteobacteria bacterium]